MKTDRRSRLIQTRDWPQADKLENVVATVRAVSSGHATDLAIGTSLGTKRGKPYNERQGRYYRLASEILGLTRRIRKNVSSLTPLGRRVLSKNVAQQDEILTRQMLRIPIFQTVLGILTTSGNKISRRRLEIATEPLADTTRGMAHRRLSTVIGWLEHLGIVERKCGKVILRQLPSSIDKIKISHPEVPVLPKGGPSKLFRAISRRKMEASSSIRFEVDATKRERANATHERLRTLLAKRIKSCNVWPTYNDLVDLAARIGKEDFIVEVKSRGKNLREQVRRAISQLYEYRYLEDLPNAKLVLLIESPLLGRDSWLLDYLTKDRGIYVIWDASGDRLFTTKDGEELPFMKLPAKTRPTIA